MVSYFEGIEVYVLRTVLLLLRSVLVLYFVIISQERSSVFAVTVIIAIKMIDNNTNTKVLIKYIIILITFGQI